MSEPTPATATPSPLRQKIAEGMALLEQGLTGKAVQLGDALLAEHPRDAEVLFFASEARLAIGDAETALALIEAANRAASGSASLMIKKAHVQVMLRRRADALATAREAAKLAGEDGRALWAISRIHANCGDVAGSRELCERAIRGNLRHPAVLYDLAGAQYFLGEFDSAEKNLDALLEIAPQAGAAAYLRSTLRRQTPARNHVPALEASLAGDLVEPSSRAAFLYALAKELEDLGQDARAVQVLNEAAALKRSTLRHDPAAELSAIDGIREAYDAATMAQASPGHDEEGPIFIVGMPRTGTTLVERMLGRQGEVGSAGELLDFGQLLALATRQAVLDNPGLSIAEASRLIDFAAVGRDYLAGLRQAAPGHRFVVDKMPINYMYCGLIRKALPKARIIHLVRDPMDTGFAVYKTHFNQAYPFSYDQAELADYYAAYRRLMEHWHAVMPGQILDVRYEDLVSDTPGQARRLLEFCGLAWNDDVLAPEANDRPATSASAAQVREPVHAGSVGKWRRYEAGLQTLKARLAEHGFASD